MRKIGLPSLLLLCILCLAACHRQDTSAKQPVPCQDFVYIEHDHFMLNGKPWFPLMMNYKALFRVKGFSARVSPDAYYQSNLSKDFQRISGMGFNSIRICLDTIPEKSNHKALYRAAEQMLDTAQLCHLKVMLLIKRPLDSELEIFTVGLLKHLAHHPALWAYDFFNEPLYYDPVQHRDKTEAYQIVKKWQSLMRENAPHQLFTIGFAEPIEVFSWDPTLMPVDFVEIHTYNPLRIASEMHWYSENCKDKPWMVGETGLPADDVRVSYEEQRKFMIQTYTLARQYHSAGYGWWYYRDNPDAHVFEGQYTGLINPEGQEKPAAKEVKKLKDIPIPDNGHSIPSNYYNMLGYNNIVLRGKVIDEKTKQPIRDAVIRGWTKDWIGMNTYSDSCGNFTLYSNDFNIHFMVSAPGMKTVSIFKDNIVYQHTSPEAAKNWRFDALPQQNLEYHSIDYHDFFDGDTMTLQFNPKHFNQSKIEGNMGVVKISKLVN